MKKFKNSKIAEGYQTFLTIYGDHSFIGVWALSNVVPVAPEKFYTNGKTNPRWKKIGLLKRASQSTSPAHIREKENFMKGLWNQQSQCC